MDQEPTAFAMRRAAVPRSAWAGRRLARAQTRLSLPILLRDRRPSRNLARVGRRGFGHRAVLHRRGRAEPSVSWKRNVERSLCYSYGLWEALDARRPQPIDVVLGRSAELGSTLYVPVYAPRIPIINMFDYYYPPCSGDLADEEGPKAPDAYFHWRRSSTAIDLLDLENGVVPWTSSRWQRDLYPVEYRDDFFVCFEGIDAKKFDSKPGARPPLEPSPAERFPKTRGSSASSPAISTDFGASIASSPWRTACSRRGPTSSVRRSAISTSAAA